MSYSIIIGPGQDIEITASHTTALNTLDGIAIHLYLAKGGNLLAKLSDNEVTGYDQQLEAIDLSTTPATFKVKLKRTLTILWEKYRGKEIDAVFYTQDEVVGYDAGDFKPALPPTPFASIADVGITTADIS